MLIGAHVSPAGGLPKAIERGTELGCEAIQIFNQSPRMWRPTAYDGDDFTAFRQAMKTSPIEAVVIHAVYLVNCASQDTEIRNKSRTSLIQSLRVGNGIGAAGVVLHPGSAKLGDVPRAIKRAGTVIQQALSESERCALHLEDTAGAGGTLGRSFGELADLLEAAGGGPRLGVCLDSCHLFASGYDIRTADGLAETLDEFDRIVGQNRLGSIHLNDSKTGLGSNRDRHAWLGEGELGQRALATFVSEPRFEGLPVVLETKPNSEQVALCRELRRRGQAARKRRSAGARGSSASAKAGGTARAKGSRAEGKDGGTTQGKARPSRSRKVG
jgi:deoxyribonuclease-4